MNKIHLLDFSFKHCSFPRKEVSGTIPSISNLKVLECSSKAVPTGIDETDLDRPTVQFSRKQLRILGFECLNPGSVYFMNHKLNFEILPLSI